MIAIVAIRPIYHLDFMITTDLSPGAVLRRIPELLVTKVVWLGLHPFDINFVRRTAKSLRGP